ncbi:hypothetical protein KQI52_12905 [bacterium]|nr:hypothetical protein [bacterium]
MGTVVIVIIAFVILIAFGSMHQREPGDDSPNIPGLIGLIIAAGLLLATCSSCG